jgi:insulysin
MTMTVSGRHDVDQLEKWVTEKFSPIENKEVVLPDLGQPTPYPAENLGKLVKLVPVKDKDILTLFWILPYVQKDIKAQPLGYYAFLFGHEGENSLLSYLKSEGLANELGAGGDHELWSFSNFYVDISLTKKGLENYEKVVEAVFEYAKKINLAGPQEYIYSENNDLGKMQFEF